MELLSFELFEELFDAFGLGGIGDECGVGGMNDDEVAETECGDEVITGGTDDAAVRIDAAVESIDGVAGGIDAVESGE